MAFTTDAVADGTYMLLIRYNGDNDKTILVQDAAETKVLSVPAASADHAWDVMHTAAVPVTLEKECHLRPPVCRRPVRHSGASCGKPRYYAGKHRRL